jgi:hypothetical protein
MSASVERAFRASVLWLMSGSCALAGGVPYVIPDDVYLDDGFSRGANYAGPYTPASMSNPFAYALPGVVDGGGFNAYDDAGIIIADEVLRGQPSLSISRRVGTLASLNVYRWIDTYTNESEEAITVDVAFWSNLGSDGLETVALQDSFRFVSYETESFRGELVPTDPVVAMMHGNNTWAAEHISLTRFDDEGPTFLSDDILRTFRLTIGASQSVSLMFADLLAYTTDESGFFGLPEDVDTAMSRSAALIADPSALFADLERGLAESIVNWTIPAPGSCATFVLMAGFALRRRRA